MASRQHGLITRQQLLALGMTSSAIRRRAEKGLLIPEHPGVYRVGHSAQTTEAAYLAAVLAGGDGAVLAGQAAGHLMRLLKSAAPPPELIATTKKRIKGVETKRVRHIDPREATTFNGVPCTTIPRTLVDLAAVLSEDALARAYHEASVMYRVRPEAVEAVLARHPRSKGAAALRRVLRGETKLTLSKLETGFLELLKENGLALPETNELVGGRYVDCRWPEHKLTVELDSYQYHSTRWAWEQDRKRERQARARGDDFRRYTWGDVFEDPEALLNELRPLLAT
jgi:very-short-patch-repair endonuclease